ncbi:hypothetical protein ACFQS3_02425 [Glycomyces mayteni]|uniref:Uncharacterized protein n=1 Tax=Glycomyces mayteni TaxID=543887 RepID=A0ABW2D3E6_9ACTN|nr:hypothetical protein GCM10025732_47850 [Glycomyces mayteni]
MNHSEEYLKRIAPDIKKAAEKVSAQFGSLEYDEIYQNLWEWVLRESYELTPSDEGGAAVRFLVQAGQRMCGKELAEKNPRQDAYFYSPKKVRELLDRGALCYIDGDIAGRSDMLTAYQTLDRDEQGSIVRAFLENGDEHKKPGAAAMALKRAVDKLAMEMNRIGENRSEWHKDRAVTGFTGSRKLVNTKSETY